MKRKSYQQQSDQEKSVNKENLITNGRYLHDQAIGIAILKVLSSPRSAVKHQTKMWHRPQQM
jgi:hypothetical protein